MAVKTYRRTALAGGGTGAMDAIDGSLLNDNDICVVMDTSGKCYIYRLSASSGASETYPTKPDVISPDANAGTKRWILADTFYAKLISANGLKFPATQAVSSDANTLDDYKEGECSLALSPGTSGVITLSASYNAASFTKIGRLVHLSAWLRVSTVSSPVGDLIVTGLPYIVRNTNSSWTAGSVWVNGLNAVANVTSFQMTTVINTYTAKISGRSNTTDIQLASAMKANSDVEFSLTYHTN